MTLESEQRLLSSSTEYNVKKDYEKINKIISTAFIFIFFSLDLSDVQ
ncbi:hypothetical protein MSIBF_A90001 [groundwater metagenome]|uniref:Uncharacterized protein n=1 Tax=groundwater metagenome TaxID=717931 RepID=A0A098EDF2_9ZZZZ